MMNRTCTIAIEFRQSELEVIPCGMSSSAALYPQPATHSFHSCASGPSQQDTAQRPRTQFGPARPTQVTNDVLSLLRENLKTVEKAQELKEIGSLLCLIVFPSALCGLRNLCFAIDLV